MHHVIRIRYKSRIFTRLVYRNFKGWYIMVGKDKTEYWFERGSAGWVLIKNNLPEEFMVQIAEQLEELYHTNNGLK